MDKLARRNNTIEFWRFIFICAICIMHFSNSYFGSSPYFDDAYVATEFFFIVSGYLLISSYYKNKETKANRINAWKYTLNKALKLYPYYIISFASVFIFVMVSEKANLFSWITNLGGSVWELVFLQISGLKCFRLFNYPTWYISAMLIVGYFIYVLLELVEKKYIKLIMPLSVLVIYCIFSKESGNIDVWGGSQILGVSDALMRAFAGMSLGGICYSGSDLLKKKQFNITKKLLLSICELFAFLLAFAIMLGTGHTQIDFYVIGLLAVGVTLSFSGQTLVGKLFGAQLFSWFGKISYPVFLNQIFVIYMMGTFLKGLGYSVGIVMFMAILITLSIIEVVLLESVKRVIRR